MKHLLLLSLLLSMSACIPKIYLPDTSPTNIPTTVPSNTNVETKPVFSKIISYKADGSFTHANGQTFFPWGFNYTNPDGIGLLEDKWDYEKTWTAIEEDFVDMKAYGANTVRIHLQFHEYMANATTRKRGAFVKLDRIVDIAEKNGLYLIVTGLGAYRDVEAPAWYINMEDEERWAAQALFWKHVAEVLAPRKNIFAYDLINEPVVAQGCNMDMESCGWSPGDRFGGFSFIQNISIDPKKKFKRTVKDWANKITTAIRSRDQKSLITIGFLPLGDLSAFEKELDFTSTHIYPNSNDLNKFIDYINEYKGTKPFVIEETFNLACSKEEMNYFYQQIKGNYNGMLGHYRGSTIEELSLKDDYVSKLFIQFLEFFQENNPN